MRVVFIAAGAGSMYCGACTRDINLVRGLLARKVDVEVIPLYTPLRIEGGDPVPVSRLFFSGLNVVMLQASGLLRLFAPLFSKTFDDPKLMNWVSQFAVETRAEKLGPMTVSMLAGKDGNQQRELNKLLEYLHAVEKPDVIHLTNSLLSGIAPEIKQQLQVPIVCSLQGEDGFIGQMPEKFCKEAQQLMHANAAAIELFIAPSNQYAKQMATFLNVPIERIHTVRAGVVPAQYANTEPCPREPFVLGYLSVITPAKGLDLLVDAFIRLSRQDLRFIKLRIAGKVLNKKFFDEQMKRIRIAGLASRVEYLGEVDLYGKVEFLKRCCLFCMPSRIAETRGMAAMEAMAAGVPVLVPATGIFPEMLGLTEGGILFPPGDSAALAQEIARLIDTPEELAALGHAGAAGVMQHYSADRSAEETLREYQRLIGQLVRFGV